MRSQRKRNNIYTIAEYLQFEKVENIKYEFHDGKVFALTGGTINHGLLCGNIYSELRNALSTKDSNCKPLTGEIKLLIEKKNVYVYPDAMVVCDELEETEKEPNAITNPKLIVEVLSKSTADYDRGDKFYKYRQIKSLQEYVLIEQDKAIVEVFYKDPSFDLWLISRYTGLEDVVKFMSIDVEIKMSDLYYDIRNLEEA